MNLENATALITGGTSGIGFAIAKVLIDSGTRVAITGRDEKKLYQAAESLNAVPIHADVTNEADVVRTYREVLQAFDHLDILVNNAGSGVFKNLVDTDRRKRGNIINICSTASLRGAPNGTAYYASKFALRGMTECWRSELRQYNIRVFLINPSEVLTNFGAAAGFTQQPNPTKLRGEDIAHMIKAVLQMDDRGFTPELTIFATNPKD